MNSRNHRKLCVIDNNIAYIGSANITDHLLSNNDIWRETSVRLVNVDIEQLQYAFNKAWGGNNQKLNADTDIDIFRLNYNWKLRRLNYKSLLNRITDSRQRIWVTNAYFSPDSRILSKLIKAKRRGVDVKILLPHVSDVAIVSFASKTFYHVMLKSKIEIYEYLPNILHAKSLIIDDYAIAGSSNMDNRSLRHDLEVDVVIQSPEAKMQLEELFLTDINQSKKIDLKDTYQQPYYQYLLGRLILIFRYFI